MLSSPSKEISKTHWRHLQLPVVTRRPLADLKKSYTADEAGLENSVSMSELKLPDEERLIHKYEQNDAVLDELVTKVDKAEATLRHSEEYVCFLEDGVYKQSNQLLRTNASSSSYRERVAVIEQ